MIASLLAQIGLPLLVKVVGHGLKQLDNDTAKTAASALDGISLDLTEKKISPDQLRQANAHIETMAKLEADRDSTIITQINESLRAEIQSQDPYVRRMRPTFGYVMAASWAVQMFAIALVIIDTPHLAGQVITAMASLSTIWSVGLSVLGIYVYKRSQEKLGHDSSSSGVFKSLPWVKLAPGDK